jgi:hypothetical protein
MRRFGYLFLLSLLLLVLCSSCGSQAKVNHVSAGKSSIQLRSAVAVVKSNSALGGPWVDVTFFAEELTEDEMVTVASKYWSPYTDNVNGKFPVFSIAFSFEKDSTVCDFRNLLNYMVYFYDSEEFPVPAKHGYAGWSFCGSASGWEVGQFGVTELAGVLQPGETIQARIKHEAVLTGDTAPLEPGVDSLPLKWDVEIDCPLRSTE